VQSFDVPAAGGIVTALRVHYRPAAVREEVDVAGGSRRGAGDAPEMGDPVRIAPEERLAVRSEDDRAHAVQATGDARRLLSGGGVPQADGFVVPAGSQRPPVRAEGDRGDAGRALGAGD